jgi:hypothetical protein
VTTPSTDGVGEMYQRLKSILGTAAAQQAKSSLQHWVEATVSPTSAPRTRGQRAAQGALEVGTTSSPVRISTCDWLSRPGARSEPQMHRCPPPGGRIVPTTCAQSMRSLVWPTHSPNTVRGATSVLKSLAQRHLEASCATLFSQGVFECRAMSLSTTTKPTLAYGRRTTALCAERVEQTMISSSSSSSQSI